VTRAAAADRNARRVGGQVAVKLHKRDHTRSRQPKPGRWIPACAGMTS